MPSKSVRKADTKIIAYTPYQRVLPGMPMVSNKLVGNGASTSTVVADADADVADADEEDEDEEDEDEDD